VITAVLYVLLYIIVTVKWHWHWCMFPCWQNTVVDFSLQVAALQFGDFYNMQYVKMYTIFMMQLQVITILMLSNYICFVIYLLMDFSPMFRLFFLMDQFPMPMLMVPMTNKHSYKIWHSSSLPSLRLDRCALTLTYERSFWFIKYS
jgi:hypothetical protein